MYHCFILFIIIIIIAAWFSLSCIFCWNVFNEGTVNKPHLVQLTMHSKINLESSVQPGKSFKRFIIFPHNNNLAWVQETPLCLQCALHLSDMYWLGPNNR